MLIKTPLYTPDPLRNAITNAYRMDEQDALKALLPYTYFAPPLLDQIKSNANQWVRETRALLVHQKLINKLLHQYDLSTDEGVALMCLAEALLRIPDTVTMDKFISDKISTIEWRNALKKDQSLFLNATTWSLFLSGKVYKPGLNQEKTLFSALTQSISRLGSAMIRPIILKMMKVLGNQFVVGETIEEALKKSFTFQQQGYLFSFDMLGEAARTAAEAKHYYKLYLHAIEQIGEVCNKTKSPQENQGISIKLSALHPRYEFTQYERLLKELPPILLSLALQAKKYNMNLTVDAEESDRLDISLDIFEQVFKDPALAHWDGLGLAVQAYQKRAFYVIDWLQQLAKEQQKRIMVRLVKGAYWDSEIKWAQVAGMENYPVFTRKHATDVSYLACARKLLAARDEIFCQFGTHNAYSISAILAMSDTCAFEFQCLYGMGTPIYDHYIQQKPQNPVRIYAPVGSHRDLLGYLVRRLLENGANSSFINLLSKEDVALDKINRDPVAYIQSVKCTPHPRIPLPKAIYKAWQNSRGVDLSNAEILNALKNSLETQYEVKRTAASIVNAKKLKTKPKTLYSPINSKKIVGEYHEATREVVEEALEVSARGLKIWGNESVEIRASTLEKAANLLEAQMNDFIALLVLEGGRTVFDSIAEVREAIDFCRYYAHRAREDLKPSILPGPTGEQNVLELHPRGIVVCISPWNFPLAIFLGQITAALVTGNAVIAKPAEQTPFIAYKAIQLLLEAGIPPEALQLTIGDGAVGGMLTKDPRIAGVVFTGSTETAKIIEKTLANREGSLAFLIAETGGLNAMILDSSALVEQSILDIANSAFNSAGQRCSALRVLFVQEEIADKLLRFLKGYLEELVVDTPTLLATDVGPVIDKAAYDKLKKHVAKMKQEECKIIAKTTLKNVDSNYFAPCVIELKNLKLLKEEVFGPILHVIRYKTNELEKVMESIINTHYGLTLGIQSRINTTCDYIAKKMPIGNIYINRNMIGAVVGVQPFGGENLSGTGPKAGGPHYLARFCVERARSTNITAFGGNAQLISLLEDD